MKERMAAYLHKPLQILWFDANELMVIVLGYLAAMSFGGLAWLLMIIVPSILIPFNRKKPRGYLLHLVYRMGFSKLQGYPLPTANKFEE